VKVDLAGQDLGHHEGLRVGLHLKCIFIHQFQTCFTEKSSNFPPVKMWNNSDMTMSKLLDPILTAHHRA
jgi:hypothetical protein